MAPLAALMISGTLILPQPPGTVSPLLQGFWLTIHICLTLLGYAALALACLGGILYLIQERQIAMGGAAGHELDATGIGQLAVSALAQGILATVIL